MFFHAYSKLGRLSTWECFLFYVDQTALTGVKVKLNLSPSNTATEYDMKDMIPHTSVRTLKHTVCYMNILIDDVIVSDQVRTGVQCWRSLCPGQTSSPPTPQGVSEWWVCPRLWPTLETSLTGWGSDRSDIHHDTKSDNRTCLLL